MKTIELDVTLAQMLDTLRRSLHEVPEEAFHETMTASIVAGFLRPYGPDSLLLELGGHGVAAVYEGEQPGPTVLVRAELDAVPVERNDTADASLLGATAVVARAHAHGFEHRCGHDAHMTMVAGLAPLLHARRPACGRVVLFFQPAEETGAGARKALDDPAFATIQPDFAVALHNLPGYPRNTVVLRGGVFACASVGMKIELHGEPSHAAEPEKGCSPAPALGELLVGLPELARDDPMDYRLLTITHTRMGRAAFGVSPGHAELFATLRAHTSEQLAAVREEAMALVRDRAAAHGLRPEVTWHDLFPETVNDLELTELLGEIATEIGVEHVVRSEPMRWSDDFGHIALEVPSVYFGLGIGEAQPGLHQEGYCFPEGVVPVGVELFYRFVTRLLATRRGQLDLASARGASPDGPRLRGA